MMACGEGFTDFMDEILRLGLQTTRHIIFFRGTPKVKTNSNILHEDELNNHSNCRGSALKGSPGAAVEQISD